MARAEYIWLVTDAVDAPIAAFTVKRELIGWLKRRTPGWVGLAESWQVTRLRDGGNAVAPVRLGTAAELLAEADRG